MLLTGNHQNRPLPNTISIDSKLCTNKKEIANEFNNYFATIWANNEIPDINTHYTSYLNTQIESTFNFDHIDNATTMHHLSKLTPSHSCDHENLSAITLKCIANKICESLTLIINESITIKQINRTCCIRINGQKYKLHESKLLPH